LAGMGSERHYEELRSGMCDIDIGFREVRTEEEAMRVTGECLRMARKSRVLYLHVWVTVG
jgi:hypothetical protein